MTDARHIRELALQALYQYDARSEEDLEDITRSIDDAPAPADEKREAIALAAAVWAEHAEADAMVAKLAPDWPTHRQPPVDRCILRLAIYEITSKRTPATVAINEAVVLAKAYGSDRSPPFINGVLDRIAKQLATPDPPTVVEPAAPPPDNPLATRVDETPSAPTDL